MLNTPQSHFAQLWLVASVCSYGGLQGAGNWDYCAVATQGVSKRNPCWTAGGRVQWAVCLRLSQGATK